METIIAMDPCADRIIEMNTSGDMTAARYPHAGVLGAANLCTGVPSSYKTASAHFTYFMLMIPKDLRRQHAQQKTRG